MMKKRLIILVLSILPSLSWNGLIAQISLPKFFSSNMVLPRNTEIKIEGKAIGETKLKLNYKNSTETVIVDQQSGEFEFTINNLVGGEELSIRLMGEKDTLMLTNIVAGDIWLCSGQSNMQYTPNMLGLSEEEFNFTTEHDIRFLYVPVQTDYLPQQDIAGGKWEVADVENVRNFSAVGYFFGQFLSEEQEVPIGLINSNLGATSIETWMSLDALKQFPQFDPVTKEIDSIGKDFSTLYDEFAAIESQWNREFYHQGPGIENGWWKEDFDYSEWEETETPMFWEYLGEEDHDGSFWFRKSFDLSPEEIQNDLLLSLNQIDDYDIVWVNGKEVGRSFGNRNFRSYGVPQEILKEQDNQLAVRVFDIGGLGGIYTNAFWGNKILNGKWRYKKGIKIDPIAFPKPTLPNGSIFSHPSLLYNGSIAPLHQLPITGVIWYQGEANENRAHEYEFLLEALISDWRSKWKNDSMPFLLVQLANYRAENDFPKDDLWPEVRESQANVAAKLPQVDIVNAIDIGDANDIHPKNKKEVGRRLGLLALHYAYEDVLVKSPSYHTHKIENSEVVIKFETYNSSIRRVNEEDEISGFQIAGADRVFHWANAEIVNKNEVKVSSDKVKDPLYVRYAWSDNPGQMNLENENGLPIFPFRTDDFELVTKGKVFTFDPHGF